MIIGIAVNKLFQLRKSVGSNFSVGQYVGCEIQVFFMYGGLGCRVFLDAGVGTIWRRREGTLGGGKAYQFATVALKIWSVMSLVIWVTSSSCTAVSCWVASYSAVAVKDRSKSSLWLVLLVKRTLTVILSCT